MSNHLRRSRQKAFEDRMVSLDEVSDGFGDESKHEVFSDGGAGALAVRGYEERVPIEERFAYRELEAVLAAYPRLQRLLRHIVRKGENRLSYIYRLAREVED